MADPIDLKDSSVSSWPTKLAEFCRGIYASKIITITIKMKEQKSELTNP